MKPLLLLLFLCACASYKGEIPVAEPELVYYTPEKIERQLAEITVPEGRGPFPGVVVVHGGAWSLRSLKVMRRLSASLASHGFTVMNINYRLSPKDPHPAAVEDLGTAIAFFRQNAEKYRLDPQRIGLWGYSSGGHTVSLHAVTKNDVQAVVSGGAPYDLTWYKDARYTNYYLGGSQKEKFRSYVEASPVTHIRSGLPPFFLYHGKNDLLVPYQQMTAFKARLKYHGVPVRSLDVGFWGHIGTLDYARLPLKKGITFLKEKLRRN